MSYKVLARKWRPKHFDDVVGQEHVARTLKNAIEQDRVAHSYLFCGARGVGKTSTARILAKAMNCKQGPTPTPCYDCVSCDEITRGQSVDVFEIDGASNRGINEIRELREGVRYAPSRDEKKVYIIDEVHMLTTEAFNALLKTLEEPPPHANFIFATTEPQKIPVTILSRCQRFDFKRISQRDIVAHLSKLCEAEGFDAEKAALQIIARQANGGMRDALSLLDQIISFSGDQITEAEIAEILGVANRKQLFALSEAVLQRDAERALLVLDEVNRYGYDLQQFASELVNHFRDLMVTATVKEPEKVTPLTESELEMARKQVKGRPSELLHRYFTVMVEGAEKMSRSGYPKLIFEMTVVRLSQLEPMEGLDLLVDRLELLEKTLEDDAGQQVQWPGSPKEGGASSDEPQEAAQPPGKSEAREAEEPARASRFVDEAGEEAERSSAPMEAVAVATMATMEEEPEPKTERKPEPQEVAPEKESTIEVCDVSELEGPDDRWRAVVAHLHEANAPVAHTCEHAHVERFTDGEVKLSFSEGFADIVEEEERSRIVRSAIDELFGEGWKVEINRREGDAPTESKTLAQERQEDLERRRSELEEAVRTHRAVRTARELFGADEARVSVKLFDE